MVISKLGLVPRREALKGLALVLIVTGFLEIVRMVLFRTLLVDEPVAKVALVASLLAVLVVFTRKVIANLGQSWALNTLALTFSFAGGFVGYLPAFMVYTRSTVVTPGALELCCAVVGAASGFVSLRAFRPLLQSEEASPEVSL